MARVGKFYDGLNYDALKTALMKRGKGVTEASAEIGYSENFIAGLKSQNKISEAAAKLLYFTYGIEPEEYLIPNEPEQPVASDPEPEEETPAAAELPGFDYDRMAQAMADKIDWTRLYKTIYVACYRAMERVNTGVDITGGKEVQHGRTA